MSTYRDLRAAGTTTRAAARLTGVSRATAGRKPRTPLYIVPPAPANRLSPAERAAVVAVLDSPRFVDQPPLQVYAQLLDEDRYLCSVSSMYRILGEHRQVRERRRLARHPARVRPELVATAPGQVYSWDITKLAGPVKGTYFDAYVMIDIYSRYIVGAVVHAHESGPLAVEMMKETFGIHGIPQVVHADRGTSMTSKTVAALLSDLEVTRSHSRPKVLQRQPLQRGMVQDLEVRTDLPRTLRLPRRCSRFSGRLRPVVQPRSSPYRDRPAHRRRRPLRPGSSQSHRPRGHPDRRESGHPRTIHQLDPTQNPAPSRRGLDQPATAGSVSRVTPTGLNHLDKYRDAGRPSEAKNCAPPRVAVMRPARKDSASFRVAKVRWWRVPATCHLTVYEVPRLPLYTRMAQARTS